MAESHARVMPSALHLTVNCAFSLQAQEQVPPTPETDDEAEGSAAHFVAHKVASRARTFTLGEKFEHGGRTWEIDDEMLDGATLYARECSIAGRFEDPVSIPDVHPTLCYGTPDFWQAFMLEVLRCLKVVDYKYGYRFVEVFEHYQLIAYAAGVARLLNLPADFPVRLMIVQPRAYGVGGPVREWTLTVAELYEYCAKVIAPKVEESLGPNPTATTGAHCLDCKARHACQTYRYATANLVDFSKRGVVEHLNPQQMGQELRVLRDAIKRLEGRYDGLHAQAENLGRAGANIPFWQMEQKEGRRAWLDNAPVPTVAGLGDLLGVNLRKPEALITPTQAIGAGIDETIIQQYSHRPKGALKLVPINTTATRKKLGAKKV
jgi:hypothetical protein